MHPDQPGQSPFASTDSTGAGTPLADRPEPPRLGILHLMVLTACVALWMGILRALALATGGDLSTLGSDSYQAMAGSLYGIGGGAGLAGLILFFARRLRGFRFPVHPGEYLLVISGISNTLWLAINPVYVWIAHRGISGQPSMWVFWSVALAAFAINAAVFVWALVRVKIRRWRIFLLSIPVCHLAGYGLMWMSVRIASPGPMFYVIQNVAPLAAAVVLLIVVIQDHLEGKRYPWSHWMGIALRLWLAVVGIVSSLWLILTWDAAL